MATARPETIVRHVRQMMLPAQTQTLSDSQLLEHFQASRDEAAFAALMQRHSGLVWIICRRVLGHTQDAEDAFQATFLALSRQGGVIRKSEAVASWLHGTAYRVAMRAKRDASRRRLHEGRARPASGKTNGCDEAWRELQAALDEEVQRLPQRQHAVFVLRVLQGKSQEEAATCLGWKPGTISGTLARARQLLRARLARRGIELSALLAGLALTGQPTQAAATLAAGTLRLALGQAAVPLPVASLLKGVINAMFSTKRKALTALLLALVLSGAALAWRSAPPRPLEPLRAAADRPQGQVKAATDAQGDPLPPGAVGRLGTVRFRHASCVRAFALSPNGKILAAGEMSDHAITLWDAETGKQMRRLEGHTGEVSALAFTPDGKTLASGAWDHTIRLWDVAKGTTRRRLLHPGADRSLVSRLAFSPDGKTLVSRSHNKMVCVWQVATGKVLHRIDVGYGISRALALSPDGKTIAAAMGDWKKGEVRLWTTDTGQEVHRLANLGIMATSVAFSPDGKTLAAGFDSALRNQPGNIVLWEVGSWRKVRTLRVEEGANSYVVFSPDGKTLVSGGSHAPRLWDAKTGKERAKCRADLHAQFPPSMDVLFDAAFSPDGKTLVTRMGPVGVEGSNTLRFWDMLTAQEVRRFAGHQGVVDCLAFSADARTLVTGSTDGTVGVWNVAGRKERRRVLAHRGTVTAVGVSARGATVYALAHPGYVYSWDAKTAKELRGFDTKSGAARSAFAPGGRVLTSWDWFGQRDNAVCLWDPETGKELRRLEPIPTGVKAVAFSADGALLALGSSEGRITLWEVKTGQFLRQIVTETEILSLAFAPDRRTLASGHPDGKIRLWEVTSGGLRLGLDHGGWPTMLAFSPDGTLLAESSTIKYGRGIDVNKVRLWDPLSGARLHSLAGHRGGVACLAFSPDGGLLASGSNDTTVLLWDASKLPRGEWPKPRSVGVKDPEKRWAELAGADAA
ncbi:MAG TPA: sigma-70 family RNA polymerase sigma factor, partial [Gemmataceae bacterium]|nr:sigma-70 family RNA polymerase sigma factor [Gemmataceae bacterium]